MQHTTNYNLKMPESTDPVQISDLSENFSSIDAIIKAATESGIQVATGSYYGNGKYGSSNPNSLSFPFSPKLVVVQCSDNGITGIFVRSASNNLVLVNSNRASINNVSWKENGLSWNCYGINSTVDNQLNESGKRYYYFAIG